MYRPASLSVSGTVSCRLCETLAHAYVEAATVVKLWCWGIAGGCRSSSVEHDSTAEVLDETQTSG